MPKSKHRKRPFLSKRWMLQFAREQENKKVRRRIYERAFPENQEYPPTIYTQSRSERNSRVLKIRREADERRQRRRGVIKQPLAA